MTLAPLAWSLLLLLLGIALAVVAALVWRLHRQGRDLHDARVHATALGYTLDVWQWRTDAGHRLAWSRGPWMPLVPQAADGAAPPRHVMPPDASAPPSSALLWDACSPDSAGALREALRQQLPLIDQTVQWSATAPFGAGRTGRLRGQAVADATGRYAGHVGTWRDAATVADTASAATLAQVDDLEDERESFAYTVSHDLRAPIRVVEGFAKILKEDHGRVLDRIGNDHLDRILAAASRMNSMIDALLGLSRLASQPVSRQTVDLSKLAGYVAEDLRRQWPDRAVTLHVQPAMQAQGDPTLLRVVLENLLGNAWKYTGQCRQPEVWFERNPQPPHAFVVRDNGAGFDMRFADRLFGAFQRLHSVNDFPGTGIGLASVRRILRRHGGDIWGTGEVGRGATFEFVLGDAARRGVS